MTEKMIRVILAAVLALVLAGCSAQEAAKPSETAETETTTTTTTAAETVTEAPAGAESSGTTDVDAINAIVESLPLNEPSDVGVVNTLGEYKGIELVADAHVEISDEEVTGYLENYILPSFTEEVTDAIRNGDTANIDYEGKKDGVAFDGGTAQGYDLAIGSGSFIDGFEAGLVGKKAGETVDLNLTFPEDYGAAELAGQAVVFTVKINSVKRQRELTDELAAELDPECRTVDDVRKKVREMLQEQNDFNEKQAIFAAAVQKVLEASDVTPDQLAVEYSVNNYIKSYAAQMQGYGLDLGTFLSYYGGSYEDFRSMYEEQFRVNVSQRAVLEEIAKLEKMEVTDEAVEKFAEAYGYDKETLTSMLSETMLHQVVLEDMANQFIVDNAKITYTEENAQ